MSTERSSQLYTGLQEMSPRKHELLTKFFPTKSQLYSVLSRLNKPEMLLLKNLKRHQRQQEGGSERQEESLEEAGSSAHPRFKINGSERSTVESVIERARPEDSFLQVRQELHNYSHHHHHHHHPPHSQHHSKPRTKTLTLPTKRESLLSSFIETLQLRPNETSSYMEKA